MKTFFLSLCPKILKIFISKEGLGLHGVLLTEFIPYGQTVNKDVYCNHLKKLRKCVQNCRRGLLTRGSHLFPKIMPGRMLQSKQTVELLKSFGWDVLQHLADLAHSSDLAPINFDNIPEIKGISRWETFFK